MTGFIIAIVAVLAILVVLQVMKVTSLSSDLQDGRDNEVSSKDNNTQGTLLLLFGIGFMVAFVWMLIAWGDLLLPRSASEVTLSQKQGDKEQLIAAAGRRTTPGERNYASWKGEYAALVYGIRKYEHILSYKPFVIKTDSITLCHQPKIKPCTGIIARWTEYLAGFDFKVQHIPGTKNVVADAISRTPAHLDNPTKDEEEEARDKKISS